MKHASIYFAGLISTTFASLCLAADPATPVATAPPVVTPVSTPSSSALLPHAVAEVVKMYQGGIGKEILIAYVDSSMVPFHLNADGIIYLQHLGLPQEVVAEMMHRDADLQKSAMAAQTPAPAPSAPPATYAPAAQPAVPTTPAPVVVSPYPTVVQQPVYYDTSPYYYPYAYPYYYGPNVIIGGGWGWGWGHGFHDGGWGHGFHGGGFHGGGGFHH
jgi:hypothetical protein